MSAFHDAIALAEKLLELKSDPHDERWQVVYELAERGASRGPELGLVEGYIHGRIALTRTLPCSITSGGCQSG